MGYLQYRFSRNWADISLFKGFVKKFNKYDYSNKKDLKEVKVNALKLNNYEQLEKTIEFEEFLSNSYFG